MCTSVSTWTQFGQVWACRTSYNPKRLVLIQYYKQEDGGGMSWFRSILDCVKLENFCFQMSECKTSHTVYKAVTEHMLPYVKVARRRYDGSTTIWVCLVISQCIVTSFPVMGPVSPHAGLVPLCVCVMLFKHVMVSDNKSNLYDRLTSVLWQSSCWVCMPWQNSTSQIVVFTSWSYVLTFVTKKNRKWHLTHVFPQCCGIMSGFFLTHRLPEATNRWAQCTIWISLHCHNELHSQKSPEIQLENNA